LCFAVLDTVEGQLAKTPAVLNLHGRVATLPKVAWQLRDDWHTRLNEQGIVWRYSELEI